ncbi:hypothetical protein FIT61_02625 [Candidatus Methylopumilus rimovensis]|uniref:Uncharacterized protein n=1 Tax=Candidatus Methylopumilus rimovensis TaxID=2588535 RepID=A0AAE6FSS4_9PROT|nr:hypothetical protein [Candidatus Methylopumilus rimovensis]QDD13356.1 hypothetical protein FIT61_02625 [Candidatus Methylopumilus rimovensis]
MGTLRKISILRIILLIKRYSLFFILLNLLTFFCTSFFLNNYVFKSFKGEVLLFTGYSIYFDNVNKIQKKINFFDIDSEVLKFNYLSSRNDTASDEIKLSKYSSSDTLILMELQGNNKLLIKQKLELETQKFLDNLKSQSSLLCSNCASIPPSIISEVLISNSTSYFKTQFAIFLFTSSMTLLSFLLYFFFIGNFKSN